MIGVIVAVALLVGALGPLLAGSVSADDRPPQVVSRLAAPVAPIEGAPYINLEQRLPSWPRYSEDSGHLAAVASDSWAVALVGYEIAWENTAAFADGFRRCFLADVRSLAENPLGEVPLGLSQRVEARSGASGGSRKQDLRRRSLLLLRFVVEEGEDIGPATKRLVDEGLAQVQAGDIEGYGRTLGREAGCLAWDVGVTRGLRLGRKHFERRAVDRAERAGDERSG